MNSSEPFSNGGTTKSLWIGLAAYFVSTFGISWFVVVVAVGIDGFPGTAEDFRTLLPMVVIAMLAGPSLAGIAGTALFLGFPGLRDYWRRLRKFRVAPRWYAIAVLVAPLVVAGVLGMLSLASPVFLPGIATTNTPANHLVTGLVTGVVAGLCEELGWTGFAIPRLRRQFGVFATGLVVGLLWGTWHLLVTWWGSTETSGSLSMLVYLPAMTLSFLPPYRVMMVWVYDRTDSILIAMLMHASLTASVRIFDPEPISGAPIVFYNLALGVAFWCCVTVVAIVNPGSFRRLNARQSIIPNSRS